MNRGRYVIGSLAVFVYLFLIEWVFHSYVMGSYYEQNMSLLRGADAGGGFFVWMIFGFLILAFGFCYIFIKGYENKGIGEGVRFGLYVAITFSVSESLINYAVFPYPASWVVGWIIGYPVIMMLAGAIIAMVYKPKTA